MVHWHLPRGRSESNFASGTISNAYHPRVTFKTSGMMCSRPLQMHACHVRNILQNIENSRPTILRSTSATGGTKHLFNLMLLQVSLRVIRVGQVGQAGLLGRVERLDGWEQRNQRDQHDQRNQRYRRDEWYEWDGSDECDEFDERSDVISGTSVTSVTSVASVTSVTSVICAISATRATRATRATSATGWTSGTSATSGTSGCVCKRIHPPPIFPQHTVIFRVRRERKIQARAIEDDENDATEVSNAGDMSGTSDGRVTGDHIGRKMGDQRDIRGGGQS